MSGPQCTVRCDPWAPLTARESGIKYLREIDGLRAVAVTAVVLYHAGLGGAGFVGVDVFFVISGYLITSLLLRDHSANGRISLSDFYARRVRRIFPAFIVVIISTLGLASLLLSPRTALHVAESAIASALFCANFFFQEVTGGYFDASSAEMPLLHLWSLAVEEQFYLLWPALLIVLLRYKLPLKPVLAGLALGSFALAEFLMAVNPEAAFYQMPARFWELAVGGLIAVIPFRLPAWTGWTGLALTVAGCLIPLPHFPGWGAFPTVAGAALVVAAVHGGARNSLLGSRPFVGIGLISYSLYLWHWPLLALYKATTVGEGSQSTRLLLCALAVALASASYRYVEQPLRKPSASRAVAVFAVAAMLTLGAFMLAGPPRPSPADLAAADAPLNALRCNFGTDDTADDFPKIGCESIPGTPAQVALWGDSMALAWQPVAVELGKRAGLSATSYSRDDCQAALGFVAPEKIAANVRCKEWNDLVLAKVREMDTVVLAGRWQRAMAPERRAGFADAMDRTLDALGSVRRVIVIGPSPELPAQVPRCLELGDWNPCTMTRAQFDADSEVGRAMLLALVADHPNAEYVDPADWLCEGSICSGHKGPIALYWDNRHVSTTAAIAFAKQME